MHGVPRHFPSTGRPLGLCSPLLEALGAQRSPEARRGVGATLLPWMPLMDGGFYKERLDGPLYVHHRFLPMARALVRYGDADLFQGLAFRPDFFTPPPALELRDAGFEHSRHDLPFLCAVDALTMGRFDLLNILDQAERLEPHKSADPTHTTWRREGPFFSDWGSTQTSTLLHSMAASFLTREQLSEAFGWVLNRCAPHASRSLAQDWMEAACHAHSMAAVESALECGAQVQYEHLVMCTEFGAYDLAAGMAHTLSKSLEPQKSTGRIPSLKTTKAPSQDLYHTMADSYSGALPYIAAGILDWHDPRDLGREMTWAHFDDHRTHLAHGIVRALLGAFDTPITRETSELSKDRLASVARAMFCGRPEDAALLHLIIQARPLAPALAEEIWMVARLTPHALVELLPQSTPEQATRSLAMLFKSFAEARQKLQHPQHYARPSDPVSLEQKKVDHCIDAIYHFTGHRQRLDSQGQIFLDQQTDHFQLSKILEQRALEEVCPPSTQRSRILKI